MKEIIIGDIKVLHPETFTECDFLENEIDLIRHEFDKLNLSGLEHLDALIKSVRIFKENNNG